MAKRFQMCITVCLLIVLMLSNIQVDNTSDLSSCYAGGFDLQTVSALEERASYGTSKGYSHIEQQDYWNVNAFVYVTANFYKRSQSVCRTYGKQCMTVTTRNICCNAKLFLMTIILFAAGSARISMPFQCLLHYIQNTDGKKRIA